MKIPEKFKADMSQSQEMTTEYFIYYPEAFDGGFEVRLVEKTLINGFIPLFAGSANQTMPGYEDVFCSV